MAALAEELLNQILAALSAGPWEERAARLLEDARAEAEAEVRAILKSAVKATLLKQALRCLEHGEDEARALDSAAHPNDPPANTRHPSAVELPKATGSYVYGITAPHALPKDVIGIDGVRAPHFIREADLQAIVSVVPLDDFGQAGLAEHVKDREWVERAVGAHDQIVRAAVAVGPVIPMRFCTILRDEQAVRDVLRIHRDRIRDALASLAGMREWGIKVRWTPPAAAPEGAASGRDYLVRKQQQSSARSSARAAAEAAVAACHRQMAALARSAVLLSVSRHQEGDVLLNAAYLVAERDETALHELASAWERQHRAEGLSCEVTGPWPAYNFVNLDLSIEPAAA